MGQPKTTQGYEESERQKLIECNRKVIQRLFDDIFGECLPSGTSYEIQSHGSPRCIDLEQERMEQEKF